MPVHAEKKGVLRLNDVDSLISIPSKEGKENISPRRGDYYNSMQLTSLTTKQTEILLLLYRYRFLTSTQIQQFLQHKNNTRISLWLKDLYDKKILSRIYSKTVGEINKPAIYYLGLKGRAHLLENKNCLPELLNRVYREKTSSRTFQNHWIFVADLYFHYQKATQEEKASFQFFTQTDLADFAYAPLSLPDAFITVKASDNTTKRYFVEVFDENARRDDIRGCIVSYCKYFKGKYWQDHYTFPFPKILLICSNDHTKEFLSRFIPKTLEKKEVDVEFFLALKSDIRERGIQINTWEAI